MQQVGNKLPQFSGNVQGAFFIPKNTKGPDAVPNDGVEAFQELRDQVANGNKEERELALDVLVNLAAGEGESGAEAQKVLRDVYAKPGCKEPDQNEPTRRHIENLSLELCKLALDPPADTALRPKFFKELNVTLAYLAGRSHEPPGGGNGGAIRDKIEHFIRGKLPEKGKQAPAQVDRQLLGGGRTIDANELTAAGGKLTSLQPSPVMLEMVPPEADDELWDSQFVEPLQALVNQLAEDNDRHCAAAWINTGDPGFQHFMPLILHKDADGTITCHVMDPDAPASKKRDVHTRLHEKLFEVIGDEDDIHIHKSDMQSRPAGAQACGALGHRLMEAVDRQMKFKSGELEPGDGEEFHSQAIAMDDFDMGRFIDSHMDDWNAMSDADQHAAMVSTRAQLLDAWAGPGSARPKGVAMADAIKVLSQSPAHRWEAMSLPDEPASLSKVQVHWPDEDDVLPDDGLSGKETSRRQQVDKEVDAPPAHNARSAVPRSEPTVLPPSDVRLPNDLQKALSSLDLHKAKTSEGTSYYASSLSSFATSYNEIGKIKGTFNQSAAITKAPEDSRKLMAALFNFEETNKVLDGNSPLLGEFFRDTEFEALCNELGKSKLIGLVSHVNANMKDLVSDLVKLAMSADTADPATRARAMQSFSRKLDEIPVTVQGLIDRVTNAVTQLEKLQSHSRNDLVAEGRQWGTASMGDRRAHDDSWKLMGRLRSLKEAMTDPNGMMQKLSTFAKNASTYPSEVAAAMRKQIASAP